MATTLAEQVTSLGSKLQTFGALRHRNYRWYWFGNIGQSAAMGMQFLIIGWLVLDLTNSPSQLGLVIFLYGIPNMSLLLFGGIFADRIDKRFLLIASQTLVGSLIFLVGTLTLFQLVSIWHLYAAAFLLGIIQGISMPARMSIVPSLVERDDLMNAVSLNQAVMNTGRIVGPSIAGGIIEYAGIAHALYFNAACYAIGIIFLAMISGVSLRGAPRQSNIVSDLREGIKFVVSTPVVFTIIGIGFSFGFFGAAYLQVLPAFAKEVLNVRADGAGVLISSIGLGSLVGSLSLASLGNTRYKNWLFIGMILFFGATLFLFAWSPWYIVSIVILFMVGMGFSSTISLGTTMLQLTTPPELLGRIMSIWLVSAALHFIGALPLGVVAEYYGWPIAVAGGATLMLMAVIWIGVLRPTLRELRI